MDAVEEIKGRLSIEDVVSEYVALKPAGRNLRGLSPFTNEKTPSFMVSPEKQIWHDFSSGKGGNMFSFVMEMEGLDFKGALEHLARKAGVDLAQYRGRGGETHEKDKKRLSAVLEAATRFYEHHFSKSRLAQNYVFKTRKFSPKIVKEFRFGFAPAGPTALNKFLSLKNINEKEQKAAGLISINQRGAVDMFRARLILPLCDPFGQVIGFTARQLGEDSNGPKYINTPQTVLYDKSRHIFGLHQAKEQIRKDKFAVLVEGNLDVIASHQAGIKVAVATAGTALTPQHLKGIKRFTADIRLAFDQDSAGLSAMERAIPIASKTGVNLSIITVKDAKDPDELIQKDPKLWEQAISRPKYALDWLIEQHKNKVDITSAQGKKQFRDALLPVVKQLEDKVEKTHYVTQISKLLGIAPNALGSVETEEKTYKKPKITQTSGPNRQSVLEDRLLSLIIFNKNAEFDLKPLKNDMFDKDNAKKMFELIKKTPNSRVDELLDIRHFRLDGAQGAGEEHPEAYPDTVRTHRSQATQRSAKSIGRVTGSAGNQAGAAEMSKDLTDYAKILELQHEELYRDVDSGELKLEVLRLKQAIVENYVKNRKTAIAEQLKQAPDDRQLLEKAKKLDELLSITRG